MPVKQKQSPRPESDNSIPFEAFMTPEKYGYEMCSHCNGYGSSLQDPPEVDRCSQCGGVGLQKKTEDK